MCKQKKPIYEWKNARVFHGGTDSSVLALSEKWNGLMERSW